MNFENSMMMLLSLRTEVDLNLRSVVVAPVADIAVAVAVAAKELERHWGE